MFSRRIIIASILLSFIFILIPSTFSQQSPSLSQTPRAHNRTIGRELTSLFKRRRVSPTPPSPTDCSIGPDGSLNCRPPPALICPPHPPVHCPPPSEPTYPYSNIRCPPPPLILCPPPPTCPTTQSHPAMQCPPPPPVRCPPPSRYDQSYHHTHPPKICPGDSWDAHIRYSIAVDDFMKSLFANRSLHYQLKFRDPFISDFDQGFVEMPALIAAKILEISGGVEYCRISLVAEIMKDHHAMNPKFWLRAFHHIVLTRPELKEELESDPLSELDESPALQPCPIGQPCPTGGGSVETQCTGQQGTSSDKKEDILWYFREDLGLNRYHATWHNQNSNQSDRHGELFFYFHRNLIARYNTERVTHSMPAITGLRFSNNLIVNPGYTPNLAGYLARPANRRIPMDLPFHERNNFQRFLAQIQSVEYDISLYRKHLTRYGGHAADELYRLVEPSAKNPNRARYGNIHNQGHQVLGSLVPKMPGEGDVITQLHTAARDPLFYQWHASIDALLLKQKRQLEPHQVVGGDFPLSWPNIRVDHVFVATATRGGPQNTLHTFWRNRDYDDGSQCRKVLDHEDFTWNFKITNTRPNRVNGTVRIFLAPSKDHNNLPFTLEQQQKFIFILDVFNTQLNPGDNAFSRSSTWTSTTSPRWNDPILQRNKGFAPNEEVLCGCGHPHNLLLPMGNDCLNGEEFDLITILTDESIYPFTYKEDPNGQCISPPVLCGVEQPGHKYSDTILPMGYPFDGRSLANFGSIRALANAVNNMAVTKINIKHYDALLSNGKTWNKLPTSRVPSTNPRCRMSRIIDNPINITTPNTIRTPTIRTTPRECWYDYHTGKQNCNPVPAGHTCEFYDFANHGILKYCHAATTTPPPRPTPAPCWLDYSGRRHCHEIPPGSYCTDYNGSKYCHIQTQIPTSPPTTAPTTRPPAECYYDLYMVQHCHDPPPATSYCFYSSAGHKHCHEGTTPSRTGCTIDQYGRQNCLTINGQTHVYTSVHNYGYNG